MSGTLATAAVIVFFGFIALAVLGSLDVAGWFIVVGGIALILIGFGDFRRHGTTTISGLRRDD